SLDAIKTQYHVKSAFVPFSGDLWKVLTMRQFRNNSLNDALVLPADQYDAGQLLYFVNQRHLVVNAKVSGRGYREARAQHGDRLKRSLAVRTRLGRRLLRIRCVYDIGSWEFRSSCSSAEQCGPCARALPAANDKGVLILNAFRGEAGSQMI